MCVGTRALAWTACLACLPVLLTAQEDPARVRPSADTVVVSEDFLIHEAMRWNLAFLSRTLDSRIAEMDVRAARSIFDPLLQGGPRFSRSDGNVAASATSLFPFRMDVGTYDVAVGGLLATSTRYALTGETQVRNGDPTFAGTLDRAYNTSWSMSVTQPLLRGFGPSITRGGVKAAQDRREAALLRMDRVAAETMAQVSVLYWTLDAAESVESARRASLERAQELLHRQQELSRLGRVAPAGLLTAEFGVAQREADLIGARQARRDAMERLVFAVYGKDAPRRVRGPQEVVTDTLPPPTPEPPSVEDAEDRAVSRRPDVQAVRMEMGAVAEELRLARNVRLPQVDLTAAYTMQSSDAKALGLSKDVISGYTGSTAAKGWQAGLSLSWPLGNRQATAQHEQARAALAQVELAVLLAENQARMDVREAARALSANRARYEKAAQAAELAAQQYRNERKLLDLDRSDAFRLLQMETQMADAELARLQAALALAQAGTAFDLAVGDLAGKYFPEGRSGWYAPGG